MNTYRQIRRQTRRARRAGLQPIVVVDSPFPVTVALLLARFAWRYRSEIAPHEPRVQKDLEAARTRVVHTLYIATHGVVVTLNEDGRQRASDPTRTEAIRAARTPPEPAPMTT